MKRFVTFLFALALTSLSLFGTGFAQAPEPLRFELSQSGKERLQFALRRDNRGRHHTSMTIAPGAFTGLDLAALKGARGLAVRFALVREAGRLDCAGSSNGEGATGNCRFTHNPSFAAFLTASGVSRPSADDLLAMTVVGTGRSLVGAFKDARMVMPSAGNLVALTAVGVSPDYVRSMAAHGYRPDKAADLIPLKALNVSSDYIRSLRGVGYDRLSADELVQLKALNVSASFIADLQRRGYRDLSVSRLVQLKALGFGPDMLVDRSGKAAGRAPRAGAHK